MEWIEIVQVLLSSMAILIYEIIIFGILLSLIVHMLKVRKKRKWETADLKEIEKKVTLDKALTNEKRGEN